MIYLDTNAFYFFFFESEKYSKGIKEVFSKIEGEGEEGLTSSLTLDELAYIVLMRLIEMEYGRHPASVVRDKPEVILEFSPQIQLIFDTVFSLGLEIAECNRDMVAGIPTLMESNLLLPRDCIHLQTMLNFGCHKILTTDKHFDGISGIERIKPEEIG